MKVKVLIGILVFLIIINLATIGSYVYFKANRADRLRDFPRSERAFRHPFAKTGDPEQDITAEQRKKILLLFRQFRNETKEINKQIMKKQNEMVLILEKDSVDSDRVNLIMQEISDLRMDIGKVAINKIIESKTFLKPKQRKRFFDAILSPGPQIGKPFKRKRPPFN